MIIDAHIHVVPPQLPGVAPMPALRQAPEALAAMLRGQMEAAGVSVALAMGALAVGDEDPLGVAGTWKIAREVPGLHPIGVIDPRRVEPDHLQRVERELAAGRVKALKAYLGYLHFSPADAAYRPYYELAQRHRIPIVFHSGDPRSSQAKLKFAHPLAIDDVAVDFPDARFVLAHFGHPWLSDAAEVVYKNVNVWADLSGLVVGDDAAFSNEQRLDQLSDLRAAVSKAFRSAERPNRFLYGSDWPSAPMAVYRTFVASAVPEACHEQVFAENARLLFRLPA